MRELVLRFLAMLSGLVRILRTISEAHLAKVTKTERQVHKTITFRNNTKVTLGRFSQIKTNSDFMETAQIKIQVQTLIQIKAAR